MLNNNQIFCRAFWNGLMVQTDGSVFPCCMGGESVGNIQEGLGNVWKGEKWQELRKKVEKGDIPSICQRCLEYEKVSGASLRLSHNLLPVSFENPKVVSLDFRISNTCNLACCECGPWASSKWEKELNITDTTNRQTKQKQKELYSFIEDHASSLRKVNIAGGEPTVMLESYRILEILEENNATDLEISCAINCQRLSLGKHSFLESLKPFKVVNLLLSIDAVGTPAESLRYGCKWKQVDRNIRTIIQEASPNINVIFHPTVSSLNIFEMPSVFRYIDQLRTEYSRNISLQGGNLLSTPVEYCLTNLPQQIKVKVEERLRKEKDLAEEALNYLEQYIQYMKSEEGNEQYYYEGLKQLQALDFRRKTKTLQIVAQ